MEPSEAREFLANVFLKVVENSIIWKILIIFECMFLIPESNLNKNYGMLPDVC